MNIFFLDESPKTAVQMLCDCHVVKMTLETAQLLCTRRRIDLGIGMKEPFRGLYLGTHMSHPCQKCLSNRSNLLWLRFYFVELLEEYMRRFEKTHGCARLLDEFRPLEDTRVPSLMELDFPRCMPDEFKSDSAVDSYRRYYSHKAKTLARFNFTKPIGWQLQWHKSLIER